MNFKGAIFDFNGTLFWDTDYHDETWMVFADELGIEMSRQKLRDELHGKVNRDIFKLLLGDTVSDEEAFRLGEEKEARYRKIMSLVPREDFPIAKGAFELIQQLVDKKIPVAIATSAPKSNVDFYKDLLNLNQWFPDDRIVFDDGSFNGKPAPDIFLIAAERLGLPASECVIFEDAVSGINAALSSGAKKVYVLKSGNHLGWNEQNDRVEMIDDFTGLVDME